MKGKNTQKLWDDIKWSNICATGISEGEAVENEFKENISRDDGQKFSKSSETH